MTAGGIGRVQTQRALLFEESRPLELESGATLAPVEVAYETYGTLDSDRANAVFVCHALSGDAHAAGHHGNPRRRGWWDTIIGPGRPLDTERFFVICPNLLGGCSGTTGPASIEELTGRAYGLRFPLLRVRDLVAVHRALLSHLGVSHLHAAVGGSLGGMQALQWALDHPVEVERAVLVCVSARLSAQNIALTAVARAAIMSDPDFQEGNYLDGPRRPRRGLSVPLDGVDAAQVRPPAPRRGRRSDDDVKRLRGRALSRPPGPELRRTLRRAELSVPHAADGLLRPVRRAGPRSRCGEHPLLGDLLRQ
jgi:homoserine O-acetyltransferase